MKRNEFPYQLTEFINKINARYDGDPLGDYVMAEDMNEVQEAISRIEKALGIRKSTLSIEDRLEQLNKFTPVQVPQIGYFESLETENMNYKNEIVQRYEFLILSRVSDLTKELSEKKVYGQVNVSGLSLEDIQNQIVQWKQRGAVGIYLNNLEKQTRAEEDSIVRSVTQEGLDLIVSGNTLKLLTNTVNSYNPEGFPLSFKENTKFIFKDFGHDNQLTQADVVMSQLLPIVRLVRQNNHELIAFTDARSKEIYNSVHTLSILLGFDYHYWGVAGGSTFERLPYTYNWPLMLSDWRTKDPQIFYINNYLERHLLNGTITFSETEGVSFYGIQTSSDGIEWLKETIPGESIEKGTLPPDRLSTYDVDRIVRLINEAPESVRIHPTKIDSDDANVFLPTNIPASHMIQNVIEAINKKNSTNSLEKDRIEEFAIKSVSGSKITGSVLIPQLVENTILAINQSNTAFDAPEPLFIDIPYADITNLQGRGTLDFASVIAGAGTFTNAQIKNTLNTYEIHNETIITSAEAEISFIKADRIQVTQLEGLKSLYVPEIEADNMETLVLQAIEAHVDQGYFNNIVTKSLESEVVISEVIYATTNFAALSDIDKGRISSLVSDIIVAKYAFIGDLQAGTINTDNIQLVSDSGLMNIHGDTFKVYSYPDENNVRNLRVLIGHLEEVTGNKEDYGFVALSKDGQTRILDHTGVYEGGIHKDAVTEETIKDQSVTGGKIKYQSIQVDHLIGKIITGDWIDGETITSRHIVANAITAEKLDAKSIKGYHIDGAIIEGAHINGAIIEAKHILAGAITADKLNITYGINLMKQGFDSFEQYSDGPIELSVGNPKVINKNKDVQTEIQSSYSLDGNKALRVMSVRNNAKLHIGRRVAINSDMPHGVSAFVRVPQGFPLSSIEMGAFLTNGELKDVTPPELADENGFIEEEDRVYEEIGVYVSSGPQELKNLYRRFSFVVEDMQSYNFIIPVITLTESNQTIIVDAIQLEELEVGADVSPWRTTSATTISGDNINTGRIDAKHIKIGQGTVFADGDIIEITDQGIIAKSQNGSAALNSKGLEIKGGAFDISSVLENKSFRIANGKLTAESLFNLIEIDPDKGFSIISKENKQILFDTDPNTGEIRMSGTFRVYSKDNPLMSWAIEDKVNEIEKEIKEIELTPGPKGDSAISAVLTNESITFAADKDGVVQNYVGNTGTFLLMEGTVNQSAGTKFEKVSETNVSATINENNGSYTIYPMTNGVSVTTGQVTFRATYKETVIDKTVTISKSIAGQTGGKGDPGAPGGKGDPGAPGAPATSYWLTSSVDTITVKYNGDYDPKTITYYAHSKTGSNNTQSYAGRFIIQTSIDGINFKQAYLSQANENEVDFSVPKDVLFIKAKFYQAGGTTYLLDEQTTPILHSADGVKQEIKRTQNTAWIQAGMRVGYSGFTQTNPNSVYICGLEYRDGYRNMVLVDKPAEIHVRDSEQTDTIPNQELSTTGIPTGTTAYIIWDNTEKDLFFIYYESVMRKTGVNKKRWRNIRGDTIEFTDSLFAIGEVET